MSVRTRSFARKMLSIVKSAGAPKEVVYNHECLVCFEDHERYLDMMKRLESDAAWEEHRSGDPNWLPKLQRIDPEMLVWLHDADYEVDNAWMARGIEHV